MGHWAVSHNTIHYSANFDWIEIMGRTSNDDRSDSMNPNNDAYDDSMDNHSNQLNPNNDAYQGQRDEEE